MPNGGKLSIKQAAEKIKAQNPSVKDMNNLELVDKWMAQNPEDEAKLDTGGVTALKFWRTSRQQRLRQEIVSESPERKGFIAGLMSPGQSDLPESPYEKKGKELVERFVAPGASSGTATAGDIFLSRILGNLLVKEPSQGMRRAAGTLNTGGSQVRAFGEAISGLPPFNIYANPAATRAAGEKLGRGDVGGAFGEMAPSIGMVGAAELARGLVPKGEPVTIRGRKIPVSSEGIPTFAKKELEGIAATEAAKISKKPFVKVMAEVAGERSEDTFIQTTRKASDTIKKTASGIYESVIDEAGPLGGNIRALLDMRSEAWKKVYRTKDPDVKRILTEEAEQADALIEREFGRVTQGRPDLAGKIREAHRIWRKGNAMNDWADTLEESTKGFTKQETAGLPSGLRQPTKIQPNRLIESIRAMEREAGGTHRAGRLSQAVGEANAEEIKKLAVLLANEEKRGQGLFATIGRLWLSRGRAGLSFSERLDPSELENLGRVVVSNGMAYSRFQNFLRIGLERGAQTAQGAFWLGRAMDTLESDQAKEKVRKIPTQAVDIAKGIF